MSKHEHILILSLDEDFVSPHQGLFYIGRVVKERAVESYYPISALCFIDRTKIFLENQGHAPGAPLKTIRYLDAHFYACYRSPYTPNATLSLSFHKSSSLSYVHSPQ